MIRPHRHGTYELRIYVGTAGPTEGVVINPVHVETILDFPIPRIGDFIQGAQPGGSQYSAKVVWVNWDFERGHVSVFAASS